jgi:TonB family protein
VQRLFLFVLLTASLSSGQGPTALDKSEPVLIQQGSPIYPPLAKTARVHGLVKVEFVVNRNGDVVSAMAVSGHPMLAPVAVDAVNAWKFRIQKMDSQEDLHLQTIFDYALGGDSPRNSPPVVFESFHRVTLTTPPMIITGGDTTSIGCPDSKSLPLLGSNENAAFVELSRANCYVKWTNRGATPLMYASSQPDVAKVRQLLRSGASVHDADSHGWTPVMYAAVHGDSVVLRALLAAGADANQSSLLGNTAMMIAASSGDFHQELVRAGAIVNAQNAAGTTTLMILADKAGSRKISAALNAGADATFQDKENRTALDYLHLAHCDRSAIREEPFSQSVPAQNSCTTLDDNSVNTERLLQSAQTASAYGR